MNRNTIKEVIHSSKADIERYHILHRNVSLDEFPLQILVGVRRCGKSFVLYQEIYKQIEAGHSWDEIMYIDFEDQRLSGFTASDFPLLLECHAELYNTRPILFLDEIQNIDGWEQFARNLADRKYTVFITGSNAKMLSREIMGQLGGRYLSAEVYPLSFHEYLQFVNVAHDEKTLLTTSGRAQVMKAYEEYFRWGGLPEAVNLPVKRSYLSSLYQRIYIGDIVTRNKVSNPKLLQLMLRKMAESVMQPISYNRIAKILSSVGGKVSVPTVSNYVGFAEDAWLILRLRNITSAFSEKETTCKYYFIDNGLLSLQLLNVDTILMENMVALSLFRKYGHDPENERVYFYNDNVEVDFYIPDDELAIQVSFSIDNDTTRAREVEALTKLPRVHPCKRRIILTYDEEYVIEDEYGTIEVLPCWKWMLSMEDMPNETTKAAIAEAKEQSQAIKEGRLKTEAIDTGSVEAMLSSIDKKD